MSQKRFSLAATAALAASLVIACAQAEEGPYPTETGMVEYEVTGMQSGTMTRYWRD